MHALLLGLSLGIGAGVAPGPLLTDVPIIGVAAILAAALPEEALAGLGIAGGLFLVWLGVEALRDVPAPVEQATSGTTAPAGSFKRGAGYRWALRGAGVLLLAAGVALAVEGAGQL